MPLVVKKPVVKLLDARFVLTVTEFPIVTELELSVGLLALGIVESVCEYDCSLDDKGVSMLIHAEQVKVLVPSLL